MMKHLIEVKQQIFNLQFSFARSVLMVLLVFFIGSCGFFRAPDKERCRKLLPREKVIDVLTDIYLMEAYLSDLQIGRPGIRDSVDFYFAGIFKQHGVTKDVFQQALDCYLLSSSEMEIIHEKILNRLSIKLSESEAELERYMRRQEEERLRTDTLELESLKTDQLELFPD